MSTSQRLGLIALPHGDLHNRVSSDITHQGHFRQLDPVTMKAVEEGRLALQVGAGDLLIVHWGFDLRERPVDDFEFFRALGFRKDDKPLIVMVISRNMTIPLAQATALGVKAFIFDDFEYGELSRLIRRTMNAMELANSTAERR